MNRSHVSCCHILLASLYSGTGKQAHRPTLPADTQAPTSTCSSKIRRCTLHVHISPRALALAAALATPPALHWCARWLCAFYMHSLAPAALATVLAAALAGSCPSWS